MSALALGPDDLVDVPLIRQAAPIRVAFLHPPVRNGGEGPLSWFVRERRGLALDLFLLALAASPAAAGGHLTLSARVWAEVIGYRDPAAGRAAISRSWSWLEKQALIHSERIGRTRSIEVLQEDGSGVHYVHPAELGEPYFQLPHEYWWAGWHRALGLPAKAALLIALSLQSDTDKFELPVSRGGRWYGLSAGTISRGLRELRERGLLWMSSTKRTTEASPIGYAYDREYQLRDLGITGRRGLAQEYRAP